MRSKDLPTSNVFLREFWALFLIFAHFGWCFVKFALVCLPPSQSGLLYSGPSRTPPDTSSIFRRVPLGSAPAVRIHAKKMRFLRPPDDVRTLNGMGLRNLSHVRNFCRRSICRRTSSPGEKKKKERKKSKKESKKKREEDPSFSIYTNSRSTANAAVMLYIYKRKKKQK